MSSGRGEDQRSWARRVRSLGDRVLDTAGQALGADHLSVEAIVAFVDGELAVGAQQRAGTHLAECPECADEVRAQVQARAAVRSAQPPCTPSELLGALQAIPGMVQALAASPRDHDGAVVLDEYGAWVAVIRPDAYDLDINRVDINRVDINRDDTSRRRGGHDPESDLPDRELPGGPHYRGGTGGRTAADPSGVPRPGRSGPRTGGHLPRPGFPLAVLLVVAIGVGAIATVPVHRHPTRDSAVVRPGDPGPTRAEPVLIAPAHNRVPSEANGGRPTQTVASVSLGHVGGSGGTFHR